MSTAMYSIVKVIKDQATLVNAAETVVTVTRPDGDAIQNVYQNINLLADKPELGLHYMAGLASFSFSWGAGVYLRKFEKQMPDGTWFVIYETTTNDLQMNNALVAKITEDMPMDGSESFRFTFYHAIGADQAGYVLGRYEIGLPYDARLMIGR